MVPSQSPIPCVTCGARISRNATSCPHCGEPDAGAKALKRHTEKLATRDPKKTLEYRLHGVGWLLMYGVGLCFVVWSVFNNFFG